MLAAAVLVCACVFGVSLSFKGKLGYPIQIAHTERLRQLDFYPSVSRMKLCVSRRYCFCILDLDDKADLIS